MNRALVMLDKVPDRCGDCRFLDAKGELCILCGTAVSEYENEVGKPDCCPIFVLMDQKYEAMPSLEGDAYLDGWNDCIRAIIRTAMEKRRRLYHNINSTSNTAVNVLQGLFMDTNCEKEEN